jgi:hypothetical protein
MMKKTKKPRGVVRILDGIPIRLIPPVGRGKIDPKAIRAAVKKVRAERLARQAAERVT